MKSLIIPFLGLLTINTGVADSPGSGVGNHYSNLTSAKIIFRTAGCGGNSDNKDHDTQVDVTVFGSHGLPIAYRHYADDVEFPDNGSTREFPLNIGDPANPSQPISDDNLAFVQKVQVSITPNGHDTWTFNQITIVLTRTDGTSASFALNACVLVSQDRRTAVIWHGSPNDYVQY